MLWNGKVILRLLRCKTEPKTAQTEGFWHKQERSAAQAASATRLCVD
jgi:hypothetical protein